MNMEGEWVRWVLRELVDWRNGRETPPPSEPCPRTILHDCAIAIAIHVQLQLINIPPFDAIHTEVGAQAPYAIHFWRDCQKMTLFQNDICKNWPSEFMDYPDRAVSHTLFNREGANSYINRRRHCDALPKPAASVWGPKELKLCQSSESQLHRKQLGREHRHAFSIWRKEGKDITNGHPRCCHSPLKPNCGWRCQLSSLKPLLGSATARADFRTIMTQLSRIYHLKSSCHQTRGFLG